jgi:hypothetical protein
VQVKVKWDDVAEKVPGRGKLVSSRTPHVIPWILGIEKERLTRSSVMPEQGESAFPDSKLMCSGVMISFPRCRRSLIVSGTDRGHNGGPRKAEVIRRRRVWAAPWPHCLSRAGT